jgi:hypothetical protein
MTYAQWLEQCRKQAAERQAEADGAQDEGEPDESDLVEAVESSDEQGGRASRFPTLAPDHPSDEDLSPGTPVKRKDGVRVDEAVNTQNASEPAKAKDPTWLPAVEYFEAGQPFEIGDISVSPFTIPHDAADPVGFVFKAEGVRMAFATDLGYIPPNVKAQLVGVDLLLLESNHDLEMLRDGPYPWAVKQRVLSRVGHLSNEAAAEFLENEYDGQAAYVILAHLSESNNLPELARVTAERALIRRASLLANRLLLAAQHEPLSAIYF